MQFVIVGLLLSLIIAAMTFAANVQLIIVGLLALLPPLSSGRLSDGVAGGGYPQFPSSSRKSMMPTEQSLLRSPRQWSQSGHGPQAASSARKSYTDFTVTIQVARCLALVGDSVLVVILDRSVEDLTSISLAVAVAIDPRDANERRHRRCEND